MGWGRILTTSDFRLLESWEKVQFLGNDQKKEQRARKPNKQLVTSYFTAYPWTIVLKADFSLIFKPA